nr:unnamed protein product [Digitaria exilis]
MSTISTDYRTLKAYSRPEIRRRQLAAATTNGNGANNTSCSPARCGDLNITYPFSLSGVQPLYCGFPAFDLTCNDSRAYLTRTYREKLYHVEDISYANQSLVVVVETTFAGDKI